MKIPDTSKLVTKADNDTKITEIEDKIPRITDLATTAALKAVENKMSHVINLIKKRLMMQKTKDIKKVFYLV